MTESPLDSRLEWIRTEVERHESALVAYAVRQLGGDVERGRDMTQEAFLRLLKEPRESVEGRTRAWLFTVVRNLCLDVKKKDRRMAPLTSTLAQTEVDGAADPDAPMMAAEQRSRVLGCLSALPESQQEVLRLKFQGGLSYAEIAAATRHSTGNVGYLIHMGLRSLRERLANEVQEGLLS